MMVQRNESGTVGGNGNTSNLVVATGSTRPLRHSVMTTWSVPATGIAASAPSTPAI